ncbi:MAG: ABC transporter substrate-binding protein [Chloroflexota bacterium]
MRYLPSTFMLFTLIFTLLLTACSPLLAPTNSATGEVTEETNENTDELCVAPSGQALRIGVLPVLNTLPIFVAQQSGFYDQLGVTVEIIPVDSARNRAIAQQAGEIDVANSDAVGTVLQVNSGHDVKIVRHDTFTAEYRFFSIVAGASSGIVSVEDLISALATDDAQVAISQNTIIEYLATTMLRSAGYEPEADDYIEVAAIPIRLEQIAQGTVATGLLPEPLTTLATEMQGGTALIDDNGIDFIPVTLTVNQSTIDSQPGDVCAFLKAYEMAVQAIAADPEAYRDNPIRIPEPLRPTYTIPQFEPPRVPTESEMQGVVDWMIESELIGSQVDYEDLVDGRFMKAILEDTVSK